MEQQPQQSTPSPSEPQSQPLSTQNGQWQVLGTSTTPSAPAPDGGVLQSANNATAPTVPLNGPTGKLDVSSSAPSPIPVSKVGPFSFKNKLTARLIWGGAAAVIAIGIITTGILAIRSHNSGNSASNVAATKTLADNLGPTTVDLSGVKLGAQSLSGQQIDVNGLLKINNQAILTPTTRPTSPTKGEIYLDSGDNNVYYYNGSSFVALGAGANNAVTSFNGQTGAITGVTSFNGQTGAVNFNAGGVTTIQGQSGDVTFSAGSGVSISGTTIGVDSTVARLDANGNNQVFTGTNQVFRNSADSMAAFIIQNSASNSILSVNSANQQVVIGNTPAPSAAPRLFIGTDSTTNQGIVVQGAVNQSASLLNVQTSNGVGLFTVGANGATFLETTGVDSAQALRVDNHTGQIAFNVDTTTQQVGIGEVAANGFALGVKGNASLDGAYALYINGTQICDQNGCNSNGSGSNFIKNNANTPISGENFAFQSQNINFAGGIIAGLQNQAADLFDLQTYDGANFTNVLRVEKTGDVLVQPSTDSTAAFQVQNALGSAKVLTVDTQNNRVGINNPNPSDALDVTGNINIDAAHELLIGGLPVCTYNGGSPICNGAGGGTVNAILNVGSTGTDANIQSNANISIQSDDPGHVGVRVLGAALQTADLLALQASDGTPLFNVSATGEVSIQNSTDSSAAFQVLNAAGTKNDLVVDTLHNRVGINEFPSSFPLDVNGDVNLDNSGSYRINGNVVCNLSGCAAAGGSGNYIQNTAYVNPSTPIQTSANIAVQSASSTDVGAVVRGAVGQTADLFDLQNSSITNVLSIGPDGQALFQNDSDSSAALAVKTQGGVTLFNVDTNSDIVTSQSAFNNGLIGKTSNSTYYGLLGTAVSLTGPGGGVQGAGGGGYGVYGNSRSNISGLFQTSDTLGANLQPTLVAKDNNSQTADLFQAQTVTGVPLFSISATGVTTIGKAGTSSGSLVVANSGGGSYTLQPVSSNSGTFAINLPNESGTICTTATTGVCETAGTGFVLLAPTSAQTDATTNSSVNINKTGASGNLLTLAKNGTNVLTVGNTGATAIANTSPIAFQVQSAAGAATIFSVDTQNSVIKLDGNNSGLLQTWANAGSSLGLLNQQATISNGSYLYSIAGYDGTNPLETVRYAPFNADGTVGSWTATTDLNNGGGTGNERVYPGAAIYNGYMYVVGGANSGAAQQTVFYAKINADGTVGTWTTSQFFKLNTAVLAAGVIAHNGYLYVLGGAQTDTSGVLGSPTAVVQYAKINPDGTLGSFCSSAAACSSPLISPSALPFARMDGQAIVSNGYLYYVGGQDGTSTGQTGVYYAKFNSDGSLGTWFTGNSLTTGRGYVSVGVLNGYLYAVGGGSTISSPVNSYDYAQLGSNGAPSAFTAVNGTLLNTSLSLGMAQANGYFYITSGNNLGGVEYASGPRVYVGGSLDLLGLNGNQSLQGGSSGGTLTAGNTLIAGSLRVTNVASFMQGVNVTGDFFAGGQTVFRPTTDSQTAFQVQNASGNSLLIADTTADTLAPDKKLNANQILTSAAVTDFTAQNGTKTWYPTDLNPNPVFINTDDEGSTPNNGFIYATRCLDVACVSRIGPTLVGQSSNGQTIGTDISMIALSNGNPFIVYQDGGTNTIRYIRCGNLACANGGGNSAPTSVPNTTGFGSGGTTVAMTSSNNTPVIIAKGSSGHLTSISCTDATCTNFGSVATLSAGTASNTPHTTKGYCSEDDRTGNISGTNYHGSTSTSCLIISSITSNKDINISVCNLNCSGLYSVTSDLPDNTQHSYSMTSSGGPTANSSAITTLGNGLPAIARYITTNATNSGSSVGIYNGNGSGGSIELITCLKLECNTGTAGGTSQEGRDYKEEILANNINGGFGIFYGVGVTRGKNGLPLIFFSNADQHLVSIQCGSDTCDPSLGLNTTTVWGTTSGFTGGVYANATGAGASSVALGSDGLPVSITQDTAFNPNHYEVIHCVDAACAQPSSYLSTGGVGLGVNNEAPFASLYVDTINSGSGTAGASFQLTQNQTVIANALQADAQGDVNIYTDTAAALRVQDSASGKYVLSIDASTKAGGTDSVNVGTINSVQGYGLNSAVASLFKNSADSTQAFSIQGANGGELFNADTTDGFITVGNGNGPTLNAIAFSSNTAGSIKGTAATSYYYKVTAVTPGGQTPVSNEQSIATSTFPKLSAPGNGTITLTPTTGGSLTTLGSYKYQVSWVTPYGETGNDVAGEASITLTGSNKTVFVSGAADACPTGGTYNVYRTQTGGLSDTERLVGSQSCGSSFVDTFSDASISAHTQISGISNGAITDTNQVSLTWSAVAGATSYNIYRGTSSGGENVVQTSNTNSFTDGSQTGGSAATMPAAVSRSLGVNTASPTANLDVRGTAVFRQLSDSSTAFQIQNAAGSPVLVVDTLDNIIAPGSSGQATTTSLLTTPYTFNSTDNIANANSIAIGGDNLPIVANTDTTLTHLLVTHCTKQDCSTGGTVDLTGSSTPTGGSFSQSDIFGSNQPNGISLKIGVDGLPLVAARDASIGSGRLVVFHCTTSNCSSATVQTVGSNNNGQGASMVINALGNPIIASNNVGNGKLDVSTCTTPTCAASSTVSLSPPSGDTFYSAGNQSTSIALYTDTLGTYGPVGAQYPVIAAHSVNSGANNRLDVYFCGSADCSSSVTVTSFKNPKDGATDHAGKWPQVVIPSGGYPIIASTDSDNNLLDILSCSSAMCTSGSWTQPGAGTYTYSDNGIGMTLGTDGNPLIVNRNADGTGTPVFVKCSNSNCSTSSITKTSIATSSGETPSITIGADGYPIVAHGAANVTQLLMSHCVDAACSGASASVFSGGDTLGSSSSLFQDLFVRRINVGLSGQGLSVDNNQLVRANKLTSDAAGNVLVQSGTATAFQVFSTAANASVLNVDGANARVGIGGITTAQNTLAVSPLQSNLGTISQTASTTVVGVGTFFTSSMIGSQLVYADGTTDTITGFTDTTHITVTTNRTHASSTFSIYYAGLQVNSSGNVGIGTTTPTSALQVNSTSTSAFSVQSATGTAALTVDTSGLNVNTQNLLALSPGGISTSVYNITLDSTNAAGSTGVSLAMDNVGLPRIVYRGGSNDAEYIQCLNVKCSSKNGPIGAYTPGTVGYGASEVIGSDGYARLVFSDTTNTRWLYAKCLNTQCGSITTPVSLGNGGAGNTLNYTASAIKLDASGNPMIALINAAGGGTGIAYYIHCTAADCSTLDSGSPVQISAGADVAKSITMGVGPDGFARIGFRDTTSGNLVYVRCNNLACSIPVTNTVDSSLPVGGGESMAIGTSDGLARFIYGNSTHQIEFTTCTNSNCSAKTPPLVIDSDTIGSFSFMSLAIGSDGLPRFSYYMPGLNTLKYAVCGNAACSSGNNLSTVDSSADDGQFNSLGLDANNSGYIAYLDNTNNHLKYAVTTSNTDVFSGSSIGSASDYYSQAFVKKLTVDRFVLQPTLDSTSAFQVDNSAGTNILTVDTTDQLVAVGTVTPTAVLTVGNSQPTDSTGNGINPNAVLNVIGAKGGNTTNSGFAAGNGAAISLQAGSGGDAVSGSTAGNGGNITLQAGAAGGGAGTAGAAGSVIIKNQGDSQTAFQVQNAAGSTTTFDVDSANNRVGIGNSSPGNLLSVGALTTATSAQLAISTGGTANNGIVIQDVASQTSGSALTIQDSSANPLATLDYAGNLTVQSITVAGGKTIKFAGVGNALNALTKNFTCNAPYSIGDVVLIDGSNAGQVTESLSGNSRFVAGVVVSGPGTAPSTCEVAIAGTVQANVDSTAVAIGDLLVSSSINAGQGMTNNTPTAGTVFGKALSATAGGGQVWVLLKGN